ncbi:IPT/TIG domain-containing protein [Streptomyces niveus]|uniref:IPT/TIG domain-containing protein n=1 Tax=Streptomyces niveus TaxID=193462 RepID=UPI0036D3E96C
MPPTISTINPSQGPTTGGTTLTLTLTGTGMTGSTAVRFGSTNASSVTVNSATQITAVTPAGSIGAAVVTVTTPGGCPYGFGQAPRIDTGHRLSLWGDR